jgi:hypothetical protein
MEKMLDLVLNEESQESSSDGVFESVSECLRRFTLNIQTTLHDVGSLFLFYPFSEAFFSEEGEDKRQGSSDRVFDSDVNPEDRRYEVGMFYGVLENLHAGLFEREAEEGMSFFSRRSKKIPVMG